MNHSVMKWLGTIVIFGIGIIVALYLSKSWKVEEYTGYKLSLKGHTFELSDGKYIKVDVKIIFGDKKDAESLSHKQNQLTYDLKSFIRTMPSGSFMSQDSIESSKFELSNKLKNKGYKIEFLTFDTEPVVFEY